MRGARWIDTKVDARMWQLELVLRAECQRGRGMMWLSSRLLSHRVMFRSITELNVMRRKLLEAGRIRYVTAPGRGQGKGRTLYWLPTVREKHVLRVLREERMPERAIEAAKAFFLPPKNELQQERQQPLRSTDLVAEEKKRTRAPAPNVSNLPNGPPRPQPTPRQRPSTPPPLGRLAKHGYRPLTPLQLRMTVTEDPATHPSFCECPDCLKTSTADNSPWSPSGIVRGLETPYSFVCACLQTAPLEQRRA